MTKRAAIVTVHAHTSTEDMALLIPQVKELATGEVAESQHSKSLGASGALTEDTSLMEAGNPLYKQILNDRDLVLDLRDCFAADSEVIPIEAAVGRISCEIKYACPPGFPVLLYGERVQESHVKLFSNASPPVTNIKVIAKN